MGTVQNTSSGSVHFAVDTESLSAFKGSSPNTNGQDILTREAVLNALDKLLPNSGVNGSGNPSPNVMSEEDHDGIQNGERPLGRPDVPATTQEQQYDPGEFEAVAAIIPKAESDRTTGHATVVDGAAARIAGVV